LVWIKNNFRLVFKRKKERKKERKKKRNYVVFNVAARLGSDPPIGVYDES
jgi:hypothetical protein